VFDPSQNKDCELTRKSESSRFSSHSDLSSSLFNTKDSSDNWLDEPTDEIESSSSSNSDSSNWPVVEVVSETSESSVSVPSEKKTKKSKPHKNTKKRGHSECGNHKVEGNEQCDGDESGTFSQWCDDDCNLRIRPMAVIAFILGLLLLVWILFLLCFCITRYRVAARKIKKRAARE
jgi:hypothetical protein